MKGFINDPMGLSAFIDLLKPEILASILPTVPFISPVKESITNAAP